MNSSRLNAAGRREVLRFELDSLTGVFCAFDITSTFRESKGYDWRRLGVQYDWILVNSANVEIPLAANERRLLAWKK
nr:hypothetical transcript [Hymenolepis microstoma]